MTLTQQRPIFPDEADAMAYGCCREIKTWAVDVQIGPARRPNYRQTVHVRAHMGTATAEVAQRESHPAPSRSAQWRSRLAGPRKLGCVPTPFQTGPIPHERRPTHPVPTPSERAAEGSRSGGKPVTTNIQILQTRRPRVHLAGPGVFRPNAKAHLASLAALCERHGLTALLPTDDCAGATDAPLARRIHG